MSEQSSITNWSTSRKFIFLLIVSYTFFYIFPFPLDALPHSDFIFKHYDGLINRIILFIGKHILQIAGLKRQMFSDSGDTAFDYVKIFTYFILALLTSVSLFIFANKKINYEKVNSWFFIFLRYTIGFYMLVYGFDKVFKSHFPFPSLEKLEQTFGESSPQGLLWAFMGYSTTYSTFLGIIEVISGAFLLFRKTKTFGALLVLMIMVNVVLINFSYDVPVKLFAMHIALFAFLIIYPNLKSIINFFFLQKETKILEQITPSLPKFISNYKKIIKGIVIIGFSIVFMNFSITNMRTDGDNTPKPALYGIYRVDYCSSDISTHNFPGSTDPDIWTRIIFDKKYTIVKRHALEELYFTTKVDTVSKTVIFISNADLKEKYKFSYDYNGDKGFLSLKDTNAGFQVMGYKIDEKKSPLVNRKFYWVEEYPFNN